MGQGSPSGGALRHCAGGPRVVQPPGGRGCLDGAAQLQEVPPADVHGPGALFVAAVNLEYGAQRLEPPGKRVAVA